MRPAAPISISGTKTANLLFVAETWRLVRASSQTKCMEKGCKKPPEMECVWADGRGRAWFCGPHFKAWVKKDPNEGMPLDIVKQRKVPRGEVGDKYGEYSKTAGPDPVRVAFAHVLNVRVAEQSNVRSIGHLTESDVRDFARLTDEADPRGVEPTLKAAKATGVKTGEGTGVGLFIPLPKNLAKKFPDLGEDDDSPSHITFLYIGDFPDVEKQETLLEILREAFRKWWPKCTATLDGLEYFDQHDKDRRVPHVHVEFNRDMGGLKHRIRQELTDAGIEVADSFPEYKPHVTLAYMPGMGAEWDGEVPEGSWDFDSIEVWGLPQLHTIKFGPSHKRVFEAWLRARVASAAFCLSKGVADPRAIRVASRFLMATSQHDNFESDPLKEQFLKERYEGGHARVPNRNPDTKGQFSDIAFSTAMGREDGVFRRQVHDEFEQWKGEQDKDKPAHPKAHHKNVALMKWLSNTSEKLGIGEHAYVVGGAVRNHLIRQPIKDLDIVIDSIKAGHDSAWLAEQIAKHIPVPTNVTTNQYGVAILTVKGDWMIDGANLKGEVIEIANARKESYGGSEGKGYKPDKVEPATIEQDTLRREFTFNTLLWRLKDLAEGPDKAEILDLTGCGRKDLEEGVLKCPRDPDIVFSDDPTRMLRAIKFTGKYGFTIPPDVAKSIHENAKKLKQMPWEAVATLLVGEVLDQPTARKSLVQMKELGLLDVVSEMIREQKPFATYMANQLRTNRKVQLLLDLMELGVPASTPISFLNPVGQARLRQITVAMPEEEASDLVDHLIKPPVDNVRVFTELALAPQDRAKIIPKARQLILDNPALAHDGAKLTDEVLRQWA